MFGKRFVLPALMVDAILLFFLWGIFRVREYMKICIKILCIFLIVVLIVNSQPPASVVQAVAIIPNKPHQELGQSGSVASLTAIQAFVRNQKMRDVLLAAQLPGVTGAIFASTRPGINQTQRIAEYFSAQKAIQRQVTALNTTQTRQRIAKNDLYTAIVARMKGEELGIPPADCPAGACDLARAAVNAAQSLYDSAKEKSDAAKDAAIKAAPYVALAAAAVAAAYAAVAACQLLPPFASLACTLVAVLLLKKAQAYLVVVTAALVAALATLATAMAAEAASLAALAAAELVLANCQNNYPDCVGHQVCTSTGCKDPTSTPGPSPTPPATSTPGPSPTPGPTSTPCPGGNCSSNGGAQLSPLQLPAGAILANLDPSGGFAYFETANLTIEVPPGAVSEPVTLVYRPQPLIPILGMKPLLSFTLESYRQVGCNAWVKSDGFKRPVSIHFSSVSEEVHGVDPTHIQLYAFNNSMNQWFPLESTYAPDVQQVIVKRIDHFPSNATLYAIMAPDAVTANN